MKRILFTLSVIFLLPVIAWSIPPSPPAPSNAATATALSANGANCSAGQAPLGVDASGAAEGCFPVVSGNSKVVDAILSGTPVIFEIKDTDGNSYYFKAYPTKTAY